MRGLMMARLVEDDTAALRPIMRYRHGFQMSFQRFWL